MTPDKAYGEAPASPIAGAELERLPKCCRTHCEAAAGRHAFAIGDALLNPVGMPFIVCKTCGNKRCPKATDCELDCTHSNETGQVGSIYG